jgi:hypothetical protein
MAEVKNEYEIKSEGEKITVVRTTTTVLDRNEAMGQLHGVTGQISQKDGEINQLKKAIDEETPQKQLEDLKRIKTELNDFKSKMGNVLKDYVEELEKDIRNEIKKKKAEKGYSRMADMNQKIVFQNQVLAQIANEKNLDVNLPVMRKMRKEFDKI